LPGPPPLPPPSPRAGRPAAAMVVVEEVDVVSAGSAGTKEGGDENHPPAAVIITGAGWDAANGFYAPTGKTWHNAPVFENDLKCLLSREPHKKPKTGEKAYGWIIGQDRKPLYGIQFEGLTPPPTGWRKFNGSAPVPQVQAMHGAEDAARKAGQAWKEQGNTLFAARRYEEAIAKWTRGLDFARRSVDADLKVALHSNRAEARLRQKQWDGALGDAEAALQLKPAHEKALLRAAVAARELRRLELAQDFVRRCLEAHPGHQEARQLMIEVEKLVEEEVSKDLSGKAKSARAKLEEALRKQAEEGDLSKIPKAFAAKDVNSRKAFKAFAGYSEKRAEQSKNEAQPALASLPYHNMGLPQDQVAMMDTFFKEMREKKKERQTAAKQAEEDYDALKKEYRHQAEQDVAEGRAETLEEMLPSEKARRLIKEKQGALKEVAKPAEAPSKPNRAALPQGDVGEIDALFAAADAATAPAAAPALPAMAASERRQRIEKAKEVVAKGGKDPAPHDRRTARERQLDAEEAEETKQRDLRIRYELQLLQARRRGEPARFEQAAGEVYCWWNLPPEIGGREIKVKTSQGGGYLTVTVRDVKIFHAKLFDTIRADDLVWSVDNGELHLTMTKGERHKLWEQLGEVGEIQHDENGEAKPETLPEPFSPGERFAKFSEMIHGDDGVEHNYDDLDPEARRLVDVLRRYKHAQATGDNNELSLAEMELDEFGKLTI